jgi:hypothetical protein
MGIGGIIKSIGRVVSYIPKNALAYVSKKILEYLISRLLSRSKQDNNKSKELILNKSEADSALEQALRNLVHAAYNTKLVVAAYPEWTQSELEAIIKSTLDNLIGTEENALVGPNGIVNIPLVTGDVLEAGTDVVIDTLSPHLAKWLKPQN